MNSTCSQYSAKAFNSPVCHRAILRVASVERRGPKPGAGSASVQPFSFRALDAAPSRPVVRRSRLGLRCSTVAFLLLLLWSLGPRRSAAATITGNLLDISLQPLTTKLVFTPTNLVLVTAAGLSAGPPRVIDTTNGAFSLLLDAGDYTVSTPLVPTRRPFGISVFETNGTVNIIDVLAAPHAYTYTNNLDYSVKATPSDTLPGALGAKLDVTSPLTKSTNTTDGADTIVIGLDPAALEAAGSPWTVSEADTNVIQFGDFVSASRDGLLTAANLSLGGGVLYTDPDLGWLHGGFEGVFTGDGSALANVIASGGEGGLTTNVVCGARTLSFTRGILTGIQ